MESTRSITPCEFPDLVDSKESQQSSAWQSIRLDRISDRIDPVQAEAAWAIILQKYAPGDVVYYGHIVQDGGAYKIQPRQLHVNQAHRVESLVQQIRSKGECSTTAPVNDKTAPTTPPFQTALCFDDIDLGSFSGRELSLTLMAFVIARGSASRIALKFRQSNLSIEYAKHILHLYDHLITQLEQDSTLEVQFLNFISQYSEKCIRQWNGPMPTTTDTCVHDLVSESVRFRPHKVAIDSWDGQLSYIDLDRRSTELALSLRALGVQREDIVPLCFEKSSLAVIVQLAVLKAGGVCTFVDARAPHERNEHVIRQTTAKLAISSPATSHVFNGNSVKVICLDMSSPLLALSKRSHDSLQSWNSNPQDAAYIVWTSGSTGVPKGIILEHSALSTSIEHHGKALGFSSDSRVLQFAAYTFDVSIADQFTTLIHGGCVCIPSEEDRMSNLTNFINRMAINQMYLTPTVAALIHPADVPTVQRLSVGGEAVPQSTIAAWAHRLSLTNIYGPAEASIWCTYIAHLDLGSDARDLGFSLGCHNYLVDPERPTELVPVGAIGEIVVQGPIVARSYLEDEIKTKAAFTSHDCAWPFRSSDTSMQMRSYRTGDLGRYTSDGSIRFIGRKDAQVKLRGQRIEIEEIQLHLSSYLPSNQQSVVEVFKPQGSEHQILVALLVFSTYSTKDPRKEAELLLEPTEQLNQTIEHLTSPLREQLARHIPNYMIPSLYIPISHIPRSTSGKLDRKLLRTQLSGISLSEVKAYEVGCLRDSHDLLPRERLLATWISSTSGISVDAIHKHSTLYSCAGDSMQAMRIAAIARNEGYYFAVKKLLAGSSVQIVAKDITVTEEPDASTPAPFSLLEVNNQKLSDILKEAAEQSSVPPHEIEDVYPCTPLQEGIFTLSLRHAGSYIGTHRILLPADVDTWRYVEAWQILAKQFPVLRTRIFYSETCAKFLQMVANKEENHGVLDTNQPNQPFVARPGRQLIRWGLSMKSGQRLFVLQGHHALYDGWSLTSLFQRARDIYRSCTVETIIPFNRFIAHLNASDLTATQKYWDLQLAHAPSSTFPSLPYVGYVPAADASTETRISSITPPPGYTIATILRTAWTLLICSYENSLDVIFGETLAGRSETTDLQAVMGPTITTVPTRIVISADWAIEKLLSAVQDHYVDIIGFEHFGLQNMHNLSRRKGEDFEFRSLLVIQSKPVVESDPLLLSGVPGIVARSYPLMLELMLGKHGSCHIRASFDQRSLDVVQAQRLLRQFAQVVNELCQVDSALSISDIQMRSSEDTRTLQAWNRHIPETIHSCVHVEVQKQCQKSPHASAIESWDRHLSYAEMLRYSTKLAVHFQHAGIGPEVFVPLCFDKSAIAVVAGLAVLMAGGACVYLDPQASQSRLETIIAQVDAVHGVCGANHKVSLDRMSALHRTIEVSFDMLDELPSGCAQYSSTVTPLNAAFVVFTSGSTGVPKGIVQDHASYCSTMRLHGPVLGSGPGRRVFQFSANTFDAFLSDVMTSLSHGACVCIPSDFERLNELGATMRRFRVNQAMFTPTVLQMLQPDEIPLVKTMTLGGELLTQGILAKWAEHMRIINLYGPSEVAIWCTYKDNLTASSDPRNIGCAIGVNTWITEVGKPDVLAAVGAIGEILISGPALARGYIKDELRTDASFITNPPWSRAFRSNADTPFRLYRTGDLGRYNVDGTINILGRGDGQVKLHGRRIELDEVENALRKHLSGKPEIAKTAAALVSTTNEDGPSVLVAFVSLVQPVTANEDELDQRVALLTAGLQKAMRRTLSHFMIPSAFIGLADIPTTLHGKVDRVQLRRIGQNISRERLHRTRPLAEVVQCNTDGEFRMQHMWAEILHIEPSAIGPDDNFLALGGDSMSAMRLTALGRSNGIPISVNSIFEAQTLRDLVKSTGNVNRESVHSEEDPDRFSLLPAGVDIGTIKDAIARICGVLPTQIEDIYPCTPMQEGLMSLSEQQPGSYIANETFKLPAHIDLGKLKDVLNSLVDMYAILRTRIVWLDNVGFVQAVVSEQAPWYGYGAVEPEEASVGRIFDHGAPLTHFTLSTASPEGISSLTWTLHHALYDGESQQHMYRAIQQLYHGFAITAPPNFNRYVRYITEAGTKSACAAYWSKQMQEFPTTSWPTAPRLQPSIARENAQQSTQIFVPIARRPSNITLSTVLKAAWSMVLGKYVNSHVVAFNLTVNGRSAPVTDIDVMPGPTLATLPWVSTMQPTWTVQEFLLRTQRQANEQTPFEHFGIQNIVRISDQTKDVGALNTILVVQPQSSDRGVSFLQQLWRPTQDLQDFNSYPLMMFCELTASGVDVTANFQTSVLTRCEAERISHQFGQTVTQLCSCDPTVTQIGTITSLSPQDCRDLRSWNKTIPERYAACLHERIFSWAKVMPDAMAIDSWDGTMSYSDLLRTCQRLAVVLKQRNVRPQQLVPFCFEKSRWTIICMLALYLCGAAYVPLDPSHPANRHREILQEIQAELLLCSDATKTHCTHLDISLQLVSDDIDHLGVSSDATFQAHVTVPTDVSHVLFTSGTTGTPKGVVIEHQHMASSIFHHAPAMNFNPGTRVLQFSSYTFDVSVAEIMTTLTRGGCVCVPSDDRRTNDLVGVMNDLEAELAILTPSVVRTLNPDNLPFLKTLILGGEIVGVDLIKGWAHKLNLINGYGPCECSVFSTIDYLADNGKHIDTIGSGIGCVCWVVDPDDHNTLMPIGCPGELVVQGPNVARGYLRAKTKDAANAFFESPPWALEEHDSSLQRYYKTGDLVRYLPDGGLRLLGRKDTQVKVRGQRLELGDVEQNLTAHELVEHALVVLAKKGPWKQRLCAVITLRSSPSVHEQDMLLNTMDQWGAQQEVMSIRQSIETKLPAYMVPAIIIAVNRLPSMPSGKIDRRRTLTWIEGMSAEHARDSLHEATGDRIIVTAKNKTEAAIEAAWASSLNLSIADMGTDRSFLSVGGDSISAMQVVAKLREQNLRTSVGDVLRCSSIQTLAPQICVDIEDAPTTHPLRQDQRFNLTPIQQLFFQLEPDAFEAGVHFNQSFTLHLRERVNPEELRDALRTLVDRHPMLRARYERDSSNVFQFIASVAPSAAVVHHIKVEALDETTAYIKASHERLNITHGPMLSADLFEIGERAQVLSLVIHHLIIDLVSWRVLLDELEKLLRHIPLGPAARSTFQAWQDMQAEYATGDMIGMHALPDMPTAREPMYWNLDPADNLNGDATVMRFELDGSTTETLLKEANVPFGTEVVELLMAATILSFSKQFPNRLPVRMFNEHHGRSAWDTRIDNSGIIGWFTVLHPFFVEATSTHDMATCITAVKDLKRAIPRNGLDNFAADFLRTDSCRPTSLYHDMELLFGYNGIYQHLSRDDALFRSCLDNKARSADASAQSRRLAMFVLSMTVVNGNLHVEFEYNINMGQKDGIHAWFHELRSTLCQFAECLPALPARSTVSDFEMLLRLPSSQARAILEHANELDKINQFADIEGIYPCTPLQNQMLHSQRQRPELYAVSNIWRLKHVDGSKVDVNRVLSAWKSLVVNRPALRTIFVRGAKNSDGSLSTLWQVVLPIVDRRIQEGGQLRSITASSLSTLEAMDPPDYTQPTYLWRLLVSEINDETFCRLDLSHAIIDGYSISMLLTDLCRTYTTPGLQSSKDVALFDLIDQLHSKQAYDTETQWQQYLVNVPVCEAGFCRGVAVSMEYQTLQKPDGQFSIDDQLTAFLRRGETTLSSVLQTMWGLVLLATIGSSSACFGYLVSGRQADVRGIEAGVGPFLDLMVQKVELGTHLKLHDVLRQVTFDNQEHSDLLHARAPKTSNLFNTMINFRKYPSPTSQQGQILSVELVSGNDPWDHDLVLEIEQHGRQVCIDFRYRTAELHAANVEGHLAACRNAWHLLLTQPEMDLTDAIPRLRMHLHPGQLSNDIHDA